MYILEAKIFCGNSSFDKFQVFFYYRQSSRLLLSDLINMCIFFLPSRCPFALTGTRAANAMKGKDNTNCAEEKESFVSCVDGGCFEPDLTRQQPTTVSPITVLYAYLASPQAATIGRCVDPTSSNAGLCANFQVRHRSCKANDMGFFETCVRCTQHGRDWQGELKASIDAGKCCSDEFERCVEDMMDKKGQLVKKGRCVDC